MGGSVHCPQCGFATSDGVTVCPRCGSGVSPAVPEVVDEEISFSLPLELLRRVDEPDETSGETRAGRPSTGEYRFAGFWVRGVAFLLDLLLSQFLAAVMVVLAVVAIGIGGALLRGMADELIPLTFLVSVVVGLLVNIFYYTVFVGRTGQTPGKKLLKLKVVRSDGGEMTYGRAFLRWVGYLINLLPLGGLLLITRAVLKLTGEVGTGEIVAVLAVVTYLGSFGYWMVVLSSQKQGLHDKVAGTYVIRL